MPKSQLGQSSLFALLGCLGRWAHGEKRRWAVKVAVRMAYSCSQLTVPPSLFPVSLMVLLTFSHILRSKDVYFSFSDDL